MASGNTNKESEFVGFRKIFWPIHNHELKKFMPMVLMMFFFLFNYTIMRDTKDTLIVNFAGAEAIPFLKFWGTLPTAILFVLIYSKLSNILKPETLFYSMVAPFFLFFLAFGFLIYPNIEFFTPTQLTANLREYASTFHAGTADTLNVLISVIERWPYALFYVGAELWGSMGISLLFWQFANQITRPSEAKRFYAGFGQLGNLALVASGLTIIYFSNIRAYVPAGVDAWGITLKWLMGSIGVGCAIIMITYNWMQKNVLTDPKLYNPIENSGKTKKSKPKLTLAESFKFLLSSPYLGCIAFVVIAYGLSMNVIEVIWKKKLQMYYSNNNDYNTFMGYFSMATGVATLFLVTIGSNIIRRYGWRIAAMSAPIVILVTGGIFFIFALKHQYAPLGIDAQYWLGFAVVIGALQNILSKATKYSLFDPTKEMAYIPLDSESKVKGKAAIDVVGARLGKSGGGLLLQFVILTVGMGNSIPILFAFVAIIVTGWLYSVVSLNKRYQAKLAEINEAEEEVNTTTSSDVSIDKLQPQKA